MTALVPPVRPRVYWRPGDDPGDRRFATIGSLDLELGGSLPEVTVAYETWGTLNAARDNAILVQHALTGDSHVSGPADAAHLTAGWWPGIVGPGCPIDTDEWFVVASNVLGGCQGTTGPSSLAPDGSPWGSRWPRVTVRDQVAVEVAVADHLGIESFASVIGGSMGGLRALEWLVGYPHRVRSAGVLACCAAASADQIGTQTVQIQAITADPKWAAGDYYDSAQGPPLDGMGIARRIAHLTYRTENELAVRFDNLSQDGEDAFGSTVPGVAQGAGRFAVTSYLDHQAARLADRFDAGTYVALTDAMSTHDVGRGRGGVAEALSTIGVPVVVAGITSDRLYPIYLQRQLADLIPTARDLIAVHSDYGHDGFLIESEAVAGVVAQTLSAARSER
ncbi:MAG TPA: homoserine O-acetyltransferase [Actinobacteria bacterium]|nr:homoserine O-acetyltransferase [Actinomycetota bacterium]